MNRDRGASTGAPSSRIPKLNNIWGLPPPTTLTAPGSSSFTIAPHFQTSNYSVVPTSPQPSHSTKRSSPETSPSMTEFNSQIEQIFKCFICLGKADAPHLCPYCSKIVCYDCIKRWLSEQRKNFCPHCRATLRLSQLVNCRFVSEISAEIEKLTEQQHKKKEDEKRKQKSEDCGAHNLPMSYYCETCREPLCSDCAMFGDKHKYHKFKKINEVYEKHVEVVKNESQTLKARLQQLNELIVQVDDNIHAVNKAKSDRSKELEKVVKDMKERLDSQLKSKLFTLIAQKESISEEVELLERMYGELQKQIDYSPQSVLISKTPEIRRMIQEVHKKPTTHFSKVHISPDFGSEIIPEYDVGEFSIDAYSDLRQTTDVVYSQPINVNGLYWRLKVYPNGTGMARGTFLSVFLEMWKGLREPTRYEYKVEMINHMDPEKSIIREFSSVFEMGECWGYNRFYKLEVLKNEGFLMPELDTIKFKFFVRAPNYYEKCREQQRYIRSLRDQRNNALRQYEELKKRTEQETGEKISATPLTLLNNIENDNEVKEETGGTLEKHSNNNDLTEPQGTLSSEQIGGGVTSSDELLEVEENAMLNWDAALQAAAQTAIALSQNDISDISTSGFMNMYSYPDEILLSSEQLDRTPETSLPDQRESIVIHHAPKLESIMCSPIEQTSELDQSEDDYHQSWIDNLTTKDRVQRFAKEYLEQIAGRIEDELLEEDDEELSADKVSVDQTEQDVDCLGQVTNRSTVDDLDTVVISNRDLHENQPSEN